MNQLTAHWASAPLGEIALVLQGQSPPGSTYNALGIGLPFLQGKAEFGALHPSHDKWCSAPVRTAEKGDILLSIRAPVGPTNLADQIYCIGRGLAAIRVPRSMSPRFVLHYLRWTAPTLVDHATGTTFDAIGGGVLRDHQIAIPPRGEQDRIVDAIESYLSRLDAAVASLEQARAKLKAYRASVLKAAVEGRLVPTEAELARAEKRDYEPADVLLKRILVERRRRWEEAELAKFKAAGRAPKDDKWKATYKEPAAPNTSGLPSLPEGWCWVNWSQVGFSQNGRLFPSGEYTNEGVRLLRPGNLHESGRVSWNEKNTKHLPAGWATRYSEFIINGRELVLNLTAQSLKDEFLGRICITSLGERCLLNQRIARLKPVLASERYLLWLFKSHWFRQFVASLNTGSLIQHMFTSQLADFVLPLPPLVEQENIADEVERLLTVGEVLSDGVTANGARIARLRQAVLKRAFEGKLVDPGPNDEPAEKLLARIRAERAATPTEKKSRARRVGSAR